MPDTFSTDDLERVLRQSCFEVFNLPLQYNIDQDTLEHKYQMLQRRLHPDNFVNQPNSALSIKVSAHINQAYGILNSPLAKTIALLQQNNIVLDLNIDKELPADFLNEQMELYEEIEDAEGNAEKLEWVAQTLKLKLNELNNKISQNFTKQNYAVIVADTKKLAFYDKLVSLIDKKTEEVW